MKVKFLLAVSVAALASAWVAGRTASAYSGQASSPIAGSSVDRVDRQRSTPFRADLAVVDTVTETAILGLTPLYTFDTSVTPVTREAEVEWVRSTVPVSLIFSNASQTATVEVWRVFLDELGRKKLKGFTSLSFTGPSSSRAGAYWTEEQYVTTSGAIELRFVLTAFSGTGTVSIRPGSF